MEEKQISSVVDLQSRGSRGSLFNSAGWEWVVGNFTVLERGRWNFQQ